MAAQIVMFRSSRGKQKVNCTKPNNARIKCLSLSVIEIVEAFAGCWTEIDSSCNHIETTAASLIRIFMLHSTRMHTIEVHRDRQMLQVFVAFEVADSSRYFPSQPLFFIACDQIDLDLPLFARKLLAFL